jgi:hypothetical protein
MRKLLSVDPAKIGRPPGQTSPDAIPEELRDGTPSPLGQTLEQLLGPGRVLHRLADLVRYASDQVVTLAGLRLPRPDPLELGNAVKRDGFHH